jgi:hypothetical protein
VPPVRLGDTDGNGHDDFGVQGAGRLLVLPGPVPPGVHVWDTLVVGTAPGGSHVAAAGDTDHDGFDDFWGNWYLYRGPFVGRRDDWDMFFPQQATTNAIGDFDADGDGWVDVLLGLEDGQAQIAYGPFPEARRATYGQFGYDPAQATLLGDRSPSGTENFVLRDVQHAGQLVGTAGWGCCGYYDAAVSLFDLSGPRGRVLTGADAFATFPESFYDERVFQPWPDASGDGLTDLVYLSDPRFGPFEGAQPRAEYPPPVRYVQYGDIVGIPDLTGDGLGDLLLGTELGWGLVPGSLRRVDPPVDPATDGTLLAVPASVNRFMAGDFDGDAWPDLATSNGQAGLGGEVWIWSGAEVHAAYVAFHPVHP